VKGGIISSSLSLIEGNPILPMTPRDGCEGGGGGRQVMWIILKFDNIIIKSANMDKGGGVKRLSTKCG
jgi:hypothetical protein